MKIAPLIATAVAMPLLMAGCSTPAPGANTPGPGADRPGNVTVAAAIEPETLNPILGYAPMGGSHFYRGLMKVGKDLRFVPDLAMAPPTIAKDAKTITFALRPNLVFSDGSPLTAHDVAATYKAAMNPANASPLMADLTEVADVAAPNDTTVVFHLKSPYAPFVKRTALGIVPAAKANEPQADSVLNTQPLGAGEFALDSWRKGEQMVLVPNPRFQGDRPTVTSVTFSYITDDATRVSRMQAGGFDTTVLPPHAVNQFAADEKWKVLTADTADYRAVVLPVKNNPVTSDKAVRKAMSMAVDRDLMVKTLLAGKGAPAYGPYPESSWAYDPTSKQTNRYNPDAAARLLDSAGWKVGPDGVRAKGAQKATFNLLYPAGDTVRQQFATAFAAAVKKVGVQVHVEGATWEVIEPRMKNDAVLFGNGSPYDPDFITYQAFHSSRAGKGFDNPGLYANKTVDAALDAARTTLDQDARAKSYRTMQKVLADEQPWIFLGFVHHNYIVLRDRYEANKMQVEGHEHGLDAGPWRYLSDWK